MTERVALVTGAGRGIGAAIAQRLAAEGIAVVVHYRRSAEAAAQVVQAINAAGGQAHAVQADLRDSDACRALIETANQCFAQPLNVLVHNAGYSGGAPLLGSDVELMRQVLETNLLAAMQLTAEALPGMLQQRFGRVVVISSAVAERGGLTGQCAYAASKAGLLGFMKTVANELSPRGDFTANAVSPGVIPTDMSQFALDRFAEPLQQAIPLRKFGEPDDIANAVAYLVSPEASYVNGHNLAVDGGLSLGHVARSKPRR